MSVVQNVLNNDEFFADTLAKLKECIEQHKKQECLLLGSIKQYI